MHLCSHTLTHNTHSHRHSHTVTHTLTLTQLTLTYTTQTHTLSRTHSHNSHTTHTLSYTLTLSHITHILTLTLSHILSHTYTHTLLASHTYTHSHTYTLSHTHTVTRPHTHTHGLPPSASGALAVSSPCTALPCCSLLAQVSPSQERVTARGTQPWGLGAPHSCGLLPWDGGGQASEHLGLQAESMEEPAWLRKHRVTPGGPVIPSTWKDLQPRKV